MEFPMPARKKKYLQPASIAAPAPAPSASPARNFFNIPEAAAYFGTTVSYIRGVIASGKLPHRKFGIRFIVRRQDVDKLWEAHDIAKA